MTKPTPSSAYLRELRDDVNQVVATTRERLAGLDGEQLSWQPGPGAWSVAECLAHLLATNSGYLSSIATVLEARPRSPKDADAPFRGGALAAWFIRQSGPEVTRKYKNPEVFAPTSADEISNCEAHALTGSLPNTWGYFLMISSQSSS